MKSVNGILSLDLIGEECNADGDVRGIKTKFVCDYSADEAIYEVNVVGVVKLLRVL